MTDAAHNLSRSLAPHRGDWMRKALEYSDVSSKDMADYLEVTPSTVSRWLNMKAPVSKQTLRLWALRTGVPLAYLETGKIPPEGDNTTPRSYNDVFRDGTVAITERPVVDLFTREAVA